MDSLANRSMRTQDVYVGTFPRFIRGGKRHLVSRSGAQQVCTLDLLNCLSKNSYARACSHTCPHTPTQGDLLVLYAPEYKLIYCIQGHRQLGTMHVHGHWQLVTAYAVYRAFWGGGIPAV
jgi:hypothetical protein